MKTEGEWLRSMIVIGGRGRLGMASVVAMVARGIRRVCYANKPM